MIYLALNPNEIITLRDYPLHNKHILEIYFKVFMKGQGETLSPVPVIDLSPMIHQLQGYARHCMFKDFIPQHPLTHYFLVDGSHRTSAAALADKQIPAVLISTDYDLRMAEQHIESGDFIGWNKPEKSMDDLFRSLAEHHKLTTRFMTVEEKAMMLIKNRDVPNYILKAWTDR